MKRKKHVMLSKESKDTIKSVFIPNHPKYGIAALARIYNVSTTSIYNVIKKEKKYENQ